MKSLDPLSAKKTFIRKKLGHTAISAIWQKEPEENIAFENFHMAVVLKTDISRKIPKYFKFV